MNTEFSVVNNLANGKISITIGSYSKDKTIFNFTRVLGVRSVFRYHPTRLIEVYGGLMSGYDFAYAKTDNGINTNYEDKGIFAWTSFVGLGFNVLKNFAITTELSVGMASMNVGVAYRF